MHREGLLASWHARKIPAGATRQQEIDEHLNHADIILLLISPDFLASDYCYEYEMQRALERYRVEQTRVIPVILRPCDWQTAKGGGLQALPRNGRPISTWEQADEALSEVAHDLRLLIERLVGKYPGLLNTRTTTRNRETILLQLQQLYQTLLAKSLQETAWIELGLTERAEAVQNATNLILRQAT